MFTKETNTNVVLEDKGNVFMENIDVSRYKISSLRNKPPVTNVIDVATAKTNVLKDHTSSLRNKLFVTNIVNIVKDEISILIEESIVWTNIKDILTAETKVFYKGNKYQCCFRR